MTVSGNNRTELMKSLSITVHQGTGDDLSLERYCVFIPYNITNFMLYEDSFLVSDILRRFRDRTIGLKPDTDSIVKIWEVMKEENKIQEDNSHIEIFKSTSSIITKKKNIRKILNEKGLLCSVSV